MEVRHPLERELVVARAQRGEQRRRAGGDRDAATRHSSRSRGPYGSAPAARSIRCWLSYQSCAAASMRSHANSSTSEERRERGEQLEALVERAHVVQHAAGDDGVPLAAVVPASWNVSREEPLALGRIRVDAERRRSRAPRAPRRGRPRGRSRSRALDVEAEATARIRTWRSRSRPSASQRSAAACRRLRATPRARARERRPSCSRRCSGSAACSSTRSRPSSAATASRSARASARIPRPPCRS